MNLFNRRGVISAAATGMWTLPHAFAQSGATPDAGAAYKRGEKQAVAHSIGTEPPKALVPAGAVDSHIHLFDPRWPRPVRQAGDVWATVDDERAKRRRLGMSRCVVVHPSSYGTDNTVLLAALAELGDSARGVVTVAPDVSDATLDELHAQGARGIRLYLTDGDRHPSPELLRTHAARLAPRGWHIELVVREKPLIDAEDVLAALPCRIVIDHFAHMTQPQGIHHPVAATVRRLLDKGHAYMKLAAVYSVSKAPAPAYDDLTSTARALIEWAPERMLWGTDWPHTTVGSRSRLPDDAVLLDQLAVWSQNPAVFKTILVDNPERLYWYR